MGGASSPGNQACASTTWRACRVGGCRRAEPQTLHKRMRPDRHVRYRRYILSHAIEVVNAAHNGVQKLPSRLRRFP